MQVSIICNRKTSIVTPEGCLLYINNEKIDVDDMLKIAEVNNMDLFNNLKNRFFRNAIFTNVGNTLIIMNPYKDIQCFEQEVINSYILVQIHYLN